MASHIFYRNIVGPGPNDRALCYFFRREQNEPLDEHTKLCPDCAEIADTVLKRARTPNTKK